MELIRQFWFCAQRLQASGQGGRASSASQETDAYEALREQVQQEATQELIVRQSGKLVLVGGIAPAEGHLAISKGDQPMVGDGHAMSVAT